MEKSIKEDLSKYAHDSWSGWMEYLFSKSIENKDGSYTIPKELADRWYRQMNTSYKNLSIQEQESDRAEANKMIEILIKNIKDW